MMTFMLKPIDLGEIYTKYNDIQLDIHLTLMVIQRPENNMFCYTFP